MTPPTNATGQRDMPRDGLFCETNENYKTSHLELKRTPEKKKQKLPEGLTRTALNFTKKMRVAFFFVIVGIFANKNV